MPYWNAMNLMERELLVRLQRASSSSTLIAQQHKETRHTADVLFKNPINLYMGVSLQRYTSKNKLRRMTSRKREQITQESISGMLRDRFVCFNSR